MAGMTNTPYNLPLTWTSHPKTRSIELKHMNQANRLSIKLIKSFKRKKAPKWSNMHLLQFKQTWQPPYFSNSLRAPKHYKNHQTSCKLALISNIFKARTVLINQFMYLKALQRKNQPKNCPNQNSQLLIFPLLKAQLQL